MAKRSETKKTDAETVREIVALIVEYDDLDDVRSLCRSRLGLKGKKLETVLGRACDRIGRAAVIHWDRELAKSIESLDRMYEEAMKIRGPKRSTALRTALAVRKEKNRLLDLYMKNRADEVFGQTIDVEFAGEQLARERLEPLGLVREGLPYSEFIRLVEIEVIKLLALKHAESKLPGTQAEDEGAEPDAVG